MVVTSLAIKKIKKQSDIIDLLVTLGECDADFNGDNGEEYLWEDAEKEGYNSNAVYLADKVVTAHFSNAVNEVETCVNEFIDQWTDHDTYYSDINIEIKSLGDTYAVCFAANGG